MKGNLYNKIFLMKAKLQKINQLPLLLSVLNLIIDYKPFKKKAIQISL